MKAVAAAWAGGRGGSRIREDDAASQAMILPEWMEHRADDQLVEIAEEDADVVALFFALNTQWLRHPMSGQRMGLDYRAITPTAELLDIAVTPSLLPDLQVMEAAAMDEFARAARRSGK